MTNVLNISEKVGRKLAGMGKWMASAESCTGGGIAASMTSVPGSSGYFKGGVVAYTNEIKMELLDVPHDVLEKYGAVSEETVIAMAKGAMKRLRTDYAVATSGIAGPGGGTPDKPVGTIWLAAGSEKKIITRCLHTDRGRVLNTEKAINEALLLLDALINETFLA